VREEVARDEAASHGYEGVLTPLLGSPMASGVSRRVMMAAGGRRCGGHLSPRWVVASGESRI